MHLNYDSFLLAHQNMPADNALNLYCYRQPHSNKPSHLSSNKWTLEEHSYDFIVPYNLPIHSVVF